MTQIDSLPVLAVSIAFNPSNPNSQTQTWTDVTSYVQDFTTRSGRQHFLDRIESSGLQMTLDNRTGFFLNGTTNGTGYVIRTRLPIKITATWLSVSYPIYFGLIESAEERLMDFLNQEIVLTCADLTKQLSLTDMNLPLFYRQFVNSTITTSTTSITVSTGSKTFTVPTLASVPATGTAVSIMAKAVQGLAPIIAVGTVSAGTTATSLIVNITNTFIAGISAGPYTSWVISIGSDMAYYGLDAGNVNDALLGNTLTISGNVLTNGSGALLYSNQTCIDLSYGGVPTNVASLQLAQGLGYTTVIGSIDFWILGQNLSNQNILAFVETGGGSYNTLAVSPSGELININGTYSTTTTTGINIIDGQWHHVGIYSTGTNIFVYCDGIFVQIPTVGGQISAQGFGLFIGNSVSAGTYQPKPIYPLSGLVSQLTVGAPYVQTTRNNILNRYKAGNLLTEQISSGDRIAEILILAGFGTITAGALSPTNYTVNDATWSTGLGTCFVQGFQSSVTGSTALSLIQQVTDTDIGAFFQTPAGVFEFDTQSYLYTATQNAPATGTAVWTDATATGTSTYYDAISSQIIRDDADVWPVVRVTPQNGVDQIATTSSSIASYGYGTLTKSGTVHVTNDAALQTAYYLASIYQSPLPRVQSVQLQSETNNGYLMPEMLNRYVNDQILFIRNQNGASTAGQISLRMGVENIQHEFKADPGYWHSTYMLDPYPKYFINQASPTYYLLFDDATYGKLDTMMLI